MSSDDKSPHVSAEINQPLFEFHLKPVLSSTDKNNSGKEF